LPVEASAVGPGGTAVPVGETGVVTVTAVAAASWVVTAVARA
jgi:hypothetical protein